MVELAIHGGLVGQLVGAHAEFVLLFAADAVHHCQVLGGHAHHARCLGHGAAHARVGVDVGRIHHRQVAQVFHTTHQVDVSRASHDIGRRCLQGAHGGAAQAVHGLRGDGVRQFGVEHDHARQVHTLLAALDHAAPDKIVDLGGVQRLIAAQHALDDFRGQVVRSHVAEATVLGTPHG
jgi:hypothetical protein